MNIGLTFNLKSSAPADPTLPDDLQEEFDSPHTIEAIASVLRGLGHSVTLLGDGREFLEKVLASRPDFVFNFAEGTGVSRSREARVPAALEMLGIPYTGSDPFTMAVTLDKECAKKLVAAAGVTVPRGLTLAPDSTVDVADLTFPIIVKPAWEGSSKGIRNRCVVASFAELKEVVASLRRDHRQPLLVEEFIEGDELTVGVYGNDPPRVLAAMRVVPVRPTAKFIYSLEVKRNWKGVIAFDCPANLPAAVQARVEQSALAAYRALGCRDISRVDFRLRDGIPYFLEVNPLPGLHPDDSDLVILARKAGWTYGRLVETILAEAIKRHRAS